MNLSQLKARLFTTPRRKQLTLSGGIIGVAILASVSIFATGPAALPTEHQEKAWPVSVSLAQPATLRPSLSAFGRLEAHRTAHIRSDLVARVDEVFVREGEWAQAGSLLVQLDSREAQLQVLERQAELAERRAQLASLQVQYELERKNADHYASRHEVAQAKLARHNDLMSKRLIAKSLHDEVLSQANQASIEYHRHVKDLTNLPNLIAAGEAQVARAEALLQQAELDLAKTRITAPFSGPVIDVLVAPGDHSSMNAPLVEIADGASFEVRVQLPDAYARRIQETHGEQVYANSEDGVRFHLNRLASHVRSGQTGMDAFFTINDLTDRLPPLGKVFNLDIKLPPEPDVVALPVQSIYENNRIYLVRDNRLVGLSVDRVGEIESEGGNYQVLIRSADIQAGDALLTTQLPRAVTGLLVDVANPSDV